MSPNRWHLELNQHADHLVKLEPQSLGVHDAQPKQLFAHGLPAPPPFKHNAITNADGEVA
jgi:hypothetical protein